MKLKKALCLVLSLVLAMSMLVGCSAQQSSQNGKKEKVTIALWGNALLQSYAPYLVEKFPNVEFEFELAVNSTDYYRYLNDRDELPDIMTVRRFSLGDVTGLKDSLYDLSDTDLAQTFYGTYLDSYTYEDGTVNWLPACAEVDSIIVNKTLFEENNIPIPTDYDSFVYACQAFEAKGIKGFCTDFGADYTCMETLQGFSIPQLTSMEGRQWRQAYESGATNQLDESIWIPVFDKFFDVKEKANIGADQAEMLNADPKVLYQEGKLAMYRGTGVDVESYSGREDDVSVLLPYFADNAEDSWYLTYPNFQVAASKKGMDNPEREKLILEIMDAMLNQDGLNCIATGKNMIPYNKDVELELLPALENIKPYVAENKLYIRLASNDMFSISQTVVEDILTGKITSSKQAFDQFNQLLSKAKEEQPVVAHIDTSVSNDFTAEHGNQAASALFNTILAESDADLIFGQACYAAGPITAGDYTATEVDYLMTRDGGNQVYMNVTGQDLFNFVQETLKIKNTRGSICNDSTLYASAGFEMDITKKDGAYTLNALTINGQPLDMEKTYKVMLVCDHDFYLTDVTEACGITDYTMDPKAKAKDFIKTRLIEKGGQLEAPTDYIRLS
ncbi:MAG: 5'-nucleotidase C-terminal domain-containing protein [Anaerotardibacter sp.]